MQDAEPTGKHAGAKGNSTRTMNTVICSILGHQLCFTEQDGRMQEISTKGKNDGHVSVSSFNKSNKHLTPVELNTCS